MGKIKGPAVFLAQFLRDEPPYNELSSICKWAASLGYKGVQIPTWDECCIDLGEASESKAYCDDYAGKLRDVGVEPTELAAHLQGQVLAVHPAYDSMMEGFHPEGLDPAARTEWATDQLKKTVLASANMGLKAVPVLSGSLAWQFLYPFPQRPAGLIEQAFDELVRRWRPVLDLAKDKGVSICFELHPVSDVFDGATYEMFLERAGDHEAACLCYDPSHFVLQALDYCEFLKLYGKRVHAFHVKDAELRCDGRVGVYGGYQSWAKRAGRFRSLGDGQVDFKRVFTLLTEAGYDGWAVLEWECCVKSPQQGAREGAPFIAEHIIEATEVAFDDFAGAGTDEARNRKLLGLGAD